MKVRKFKNLWLMGLIMFGVILSTIYILKLVCPEFVIGVAELPAIVIFGNYVDTHIWAYYVFTFFTSIAVNYFYVCACCRKKCPSLRDWCIMIAQVLFLFVVQKYLPEYYLTLNILSMLVVPMLICVLDRKTEIKYFYSTVGCLTINLLAQMFSLLIRDISTKIAYPNSATYFILLIDVYIWSVLLYNYFNYKEIK